MALVNTFFVMFYEEVESVLTREWFLDVEFFQKLSYRIH